MTFLDHTANHGGSYQPPRLYKCGPTSRSRYDSFITFSHKSTLSDTDLSVGVLTCLQAPFSCALEIALLQAGTLCTGATTTTFIGEPPLHFLPMYQINYLPLEGGDHSLILVDSNHLTIVSVFSYTFRLRNHFCSHVLHRNGLCSYDSNQEHDRQTTIPGTTEGQKLEENDQARLDQRNKTSPPTPSRLHTGNTTQPYSTSTRQAAPTTHEKQRLQGLLLRNHFQEENFT